MPLAVASTSTAPTSAVHGALEETPSEMESSSLITSALSLLTSIAEDMGLSFGGDCSVVQCSHILTPATDAHPTPQAWVVSPPASSESFSSMPSTTSTSMPSQCPSSPSESMLDVSAKGQFGVSTLVNLDYNFFLSWLVRFLAPVCLGCGM